MKHLLFSSHFVNFYRKSTKSTALTETHQTVLNCSNGILFFLMALYRLSWIISVINSSLETVRHQQLDIFVKGHFFTFYLSPSGWHWRRCVSEPKWWRAWFTWRAREQSFVPWRHNSSGFIRAVWDETHHKQFYIYADSSGIGVHVEENGSLEQLCLLCVWCFTVPHPLLVMRWLPVLKKWWLPELQLVLGVVAMFHDQKLPL